MDCPTHSSNRRTRSCVCSRAWPTDSGPPTTSSHCACSTEAATARRYRVVRMLRDRPTDTSQEPPIWRQFVSQLVQFFALMLWVAGILALVAGLPQLGIAIFIVILINGTFAFAQEFRAERASERLRDLLPRRVSVIRDDDRRENAPHE